MDTAFSRLPRAIQKALVRLAPGAIVYVPKTHPESRVRPENVSRLFMLYMDAGRSRREAIGRISSQYSVTRRHIRSLLKRKFS